MQFGDPTMFWLLALVPVLSWFLFWAFRARRRALERVVAMPLAGRLTASVQPAVRRWQAVLLVGAVLASVLALTQPRWGFEWREVKRRGVDLFVLLDVSQSMLAEDVRPNRLAQAKFAVRDLVQKLDGDRIGLIAFAGTAFVQCPLTVDYEAFKLTLEETRPGIIPRGGTAIERAVRTALQAFAAGEGRDRAIVLITDGEETEGNCRAAAAEAARAGVRIYAIGVGSPDGELIPRREGGRPVEFVKDREGRVVKSRLDEETLRQLAVTTGGMYVRSAAGDFGLDEIYDKGIRQLRREEVEARLQKKYFERFQWPLGVALAMLLLEMLLTDRRQTETGTERRSPGRRRASVAGRAAVALWVAATLSLRADPATRLYEQGRYAEAWERLRKEAENQNQNWPLLYNLGVAAYKAGQWEEARRAFEQATASPRRDLQARALYNLGNTHFRFGQVAEGQGPAAALPHYERSRQAYEGALALDPNDPDAQFNLEVVKKKIEELKKQPQSPSQSPAPNQDQSQEQNQKSSQENPGSPENQQPTPSPSDSTQPHPPQLPPSSPEATSGGQPSPHRPAPPNGTNQFEQVKARILLDNLRNEERLWNFFPQLQMHRIEPDEPAKDW